MRPNCKRCDKALTGVVDDNLLTTCPNCGKVWKLTENKDQIEITVLSVQPGKHGFVSSFKN